MAKGRSSSSNIAPLGTGTRLELATRYRWWTYPGRRVHHHDQKDHALGLEAGLQHDFENGWRIDVDAQFIRRRSNDDRYDENLKRLMLSVRKSFSIDL